MNIILRIVFAMVLGFLATGLLDYFGLINHALNVLIGLAISLYVFFGPMP